MRHRTRPKWRVTLVATALAGATAASIGFAATDGFQITTFAGGGGSLGDGGDAKQALLTQPGAIAQMKDGSLLIADTAANRVRLVEMNGRITTFAGTGVAGGAGDGGPASAAQLSGPQGVAVREDGSVLIADTGNHRIRIVTSDPSRSITTFAGVGSAGFSGDNNRATLAQLNSPTGVAELPNSGGVLIADKGNHRIRRVSVGQIITTVAGNGASDGQVSSGQVFAPTTSLNSPSSVAAYNNGYLIADTGNNRIRWVDSTGFIKTFAGTGAVGFAGDGQPAVAALLSGPTGLSVSASGEILIADTGNGRIRKITGTAETIDTIAGNGTVGFGGDNAQPAGSALSGPRAAISANPSWLAANRQATAYFVADTGNGRIRLVTTAAAPPVATITSISIDIAGVSGRKPLKFIRGKATIPYGQRNQLLRVRYRASQPGRANLLVLRGKRGVGAFGPPQGTVANSGTIAFRLKGAPVCYDLRLKFEVGGNPQVTAGQKPQICVAPRRR